MNCHYLTQRNHTTDGKLQGVRCKKEATHGDFCKVHSYTADRHIGAGPGPGYITKTEGAAMLVCTVCNGEFHVGDHAQRGADGSGWVHLRCKKEDGRMFAEDHPVTVLGKAFDRYMMHYGLTPHVAATEMRKKIREIVAAWEDKERVQLSEVQRTSLGGAIQSVWSDEYEGERFTYYSPLRPLSPTLMPEGTVYIVEVGRDPRIVVTTNPLPDDY